MLSLCSRSKIISFIQLMQSWNFWNNEKLLTLLSILWPFVYNEIIRIYLHTEWCFYILAKRAFLKFHPQKYLIPAHCYKGYLSPVPASRIYFTSWTFVWFVIKILLISWFCYEEFHYLRPISGNWNIFRFFQILLLNIKC